MDTECHVVHRHEPPFDFRQGVYRQSSCPSTGNARRGLSTPRAGPVFWLSQALIQDTMLVCPCLQVSKEPRYVEIGSVGHDNQRTATLLAELQWG